MYNQLIYNIKVVFLYFSLKHLKKILTTIVIVLMAIRTIKYILLKELFSLSSYSNFVLKFMVMITWPFIFIFNIVL